LYLAADRSRSRLFRSDLLARFAPVGAPRLAAVPARPSAAQAKDDFVRALIDLSQAVGGATRTRPRCGRRSTPWPRARAVGRRRRARRGGIQGRDRRRGAGRGRAHARHAGATYLERGRLTEALVHLDRAAALDSVVSRRRTCCAASGARSCIRTTRPPRAFAAARRLDPGRRQAAYQYLRATRGAAAAPDRAASLDVLLKAASSGPGPPSILRGSPRSAR
jgi:hypothetical protein